MWDIEYIRKNTQEETTMTASATTIAVEDPFEEYLEWAEYQNELIRSELAVRYVPSDDDIYIVDSAIVPDQTIEA